MILVTHNNEDKIRTILTNNLSKEICVIDNHSNDKTPEIIFEYCKEYTNIKFIQMADGKLENTIKKYESIYGEVIII